MESVIRKELEREEAELTANTNQSSWKKYIGLQSSSIEEKYRQQCVKELDKVFISRQQIDQTTKNSHAV
jgi:hypothetical protein